ncbi:hypothetical protein Tco_0567951 [Tanacetum coccineum]
MHKDTPHHPFDALNSIKNDDDLGTNGRNSKSVGKGFLNVAHGSFSNTLIIDKIDKLERQLLDGKLMFVDNDRNPLVPTSNVDSDSKVEVVFDEITNLMASTSFKGGSDTGYGTNSMSEQRIETKRDDDYDPYDDDLYESHDMSDHLQAICDNLDITIVNFLEKACLDSFGEHAVYCKELSGFKYRHDMVRDVLFDICRRAGISAKKEAPVNFLTDPSDGRSTLRPTDVLVFGWVGGKHACVDLTGVSPLVRLSSRGFTAGQAALKAASCKVTKHEIACIENQHVFISFAFDTFGFLAPEAVELLSRVQRFTHINVMTPKSTNVVFKRIGFAIQKGLAAQLVSPLPSTTV